MNCKKCGAEVATSASFCEYCGAPINQEEALQQSYSAPAAYTTTAAVAQPEVVEKKENVLIGLVGALIGAAIGGGSIVLLGRMGITASICGFILAVCTFKGYELLGGKLGKLGLLLCLVIIAVTPYIADRIDWAFVVLEAYGDMGVTFGQAFNAVPALVAEEAIDKGGYISNLLMLYLFTAIGGFSVIFSTFKGKKK